MNPDWMSKGVNLQNNNTTEINLIDLLGNVHISQNGNDKEKQIEDFQIRMLEEFCSTSKINKQSNVDDEQFALFFDKYEKTKEESKLNSGNFNALIQNTEHVKGLSTPNTSFNFNNDSKGKTCAYKLSYNDKADSKQSENACAFNLGDRPPRILVPKLELHHEPDERVNEDLIEEVLFEQQLEKRIYKAEDIKTEAREMPVKESQKREDLNSDSNILNEIINKNRVKHFNKPQINIMNGDKIPESSLSKEDRSEKTKLEQKALTQELVTKYDVKYLETVKKNDKIFRSSAFKSDAEKLNLTAGPSLYEKSLVLPQIMQRLKERQKVLEDRGRLRMRLILEGGSDKANVKNNKLLDELPEPEVLMTDCNKERLRANESAKLFNSYVRFGSFQK